MHLYIMYLTHLFIHFRLDYDACFTSKIKSCCMESLVVLINNNNNNNNNNFISITFILIHYIVINLYNRTRYLEGSKWFAINLFILHLPKVVQNQR